MNTIHYKISILKKKKPKPNPKNKIALFITFGNG